tara:strand:- start:956 stop:1117 length:162 start_codon:yes stop_codon:yes gene_type:complete
MTRLETTVAVADGHVYSVSHSKPVTEPPLEAEVTSELIDSNVNVVVVGAETTV